MNIALLYPTRERNTTGIRNLTKGSIIETLKKDQQNQYFFSDDTYFNQDIMPFSNIKWGGYEAECTRYDFLCYCKKIDVLHSYWNTFDLMKAGCKKIITIYDLIPLIHPEWHTLYDYFDGPLRRTVEMADFVLTDSEFTRNDVIKYYNIAPEKSKTIYPGLLHTLDFDCKDRNVLSKFNICGDYIMSVCTIEPRKNLRGLINGFIAFKQRHPQNRLKLVLVGKIGWDKEFETDISRLDEFRDDIILTGFVTDDELASLYNFALAVAYVSFYEGFGLPILEALSAGKAVISSDTTSMPEVGGEAVCYCNPYEVESICASLEKVVLDDSYRQKLESMSRDQAMKFSYTKAAEETVEVYNWLGGNR